MASPGPKAIGYLELNIDGFDKAIKSAKNLLGGLAAGFAAFKVGEFFKDGIKDAIDFGKEMQNASRTMAGFDPGNILLVQKALEKTGMGAQEAQGHIDDFIKSGRDISEIFMGADNYAAALKDASKDYGQQADILTRSGKALQTVWNTMEAISSKVRTFFLAMTEQFVKPLQVALDYLNQIDLGSIGEEFGKYIADAANILIGLFANGDIYTALQLGLTLAFKESVNWLVGGFNYLANLTIPYIGEQLGKALLWSVEMMKKGFDLIFSGEGVQTFAEAFVGIASKFIASILDGLNVIFRTMQAGVQYAVQAGIEAIPGAKEFLGMSGVESQSFGDLYDQTSGIVPQDIIDSLKNAGGQLLDGVGEKLSGLKEAMFKPGEAGVFQKANVFNTDDDKAKFADVIGRATATAQEMGGKAGKGEQASKILTNLSTNAGSRYVIADNLAKVGGGGGYLKVGMTLSERTAVEQLKAQKQSEKTLQAIKKNTEPRTRPVTLAR
jgi:hypothetical protein